MKEYLPHVSEYEAKGEYPLEFHKKLGELGLFAMDVPEEYGGLGLDAVTTCLIREAIGYVDAGFASSFAASTFGIKPVLLAGTEEQKKAYGARLAEGQISAMCLTEPQSGSDMGNTKCRAVKDGDEYVLNGTKCFITNGGIADIYTVAASTSPELGSAGISLFIVDRNTPGVSVGKEEDKLGIRTSNTTDVIFQDVRIPATNLIGEENKGFAISQKLLARTRPTGMASALGVAQRALDLAVDYAQQRVTFGKPIASRQAIKFKLADMEIRLQTARAQLFYNAQLIDKGIYDGMLGSVTKTCVSEMVFDVANQALNRLDVDKMGLDLTDRKMLLAMIEKFGGRPVGVDTLAVYIGEESETIEDVYEPYLIQLGYIQRTPRGRVVTKSGYEHFGYRYPAEEHASQIKINGI